MADFFPPADTPLTLASPTGKPDLVFQKVGTKPGTGDSGFEFSEGNHLCSDYNVDLSSHFTFTLWMKVDMAEILINEEQRFLTVGNVRELGIMDRRRRRPSRSRSPTS